MARILHRWCSRRMASVLLALAFTGPLPAQSDGTGGKLRLTGGVTQVEGSAGGGLTPWALIGGYGTRDQIGGHVFHTRIELDDYRLDSQGVLLGFHDRLELSLARQRFDTRAVGEALGLGRGFTIRQDIVGVKLRLFGDAVFEQDSWLPQVAVGFQHKRNDRGELLSAIGARGDSGTDFYLSASKLWLSRSLLLNATVRFTRANQFGLLGFGGDRQRGYRPRLEGSAAWLLRRDLALGVEYRSKPDNLSIAVEDDAWDVFLAWAPTKWLSVTAAYVDLGDIVGAGAQRGGYLSLQLGF